MTFLANDLQLQLAFSLYESKGVFAVLIGSGLSRAAEIPTGWEITLDLIRRANLAQGGEEQEDWAAWYRSKTGQEPNYSTLLENLGASPEERRSIMHSYIEPSEEDRAAGRKVPTPAHRAIAQLVRAGYLRVLVTTNFDRLMENALREVGIEPTVITSVDTLHGAEPITHSACYILKLHGDYKDARILNTDAELSTYPPEYDQLLDRIMDEYGLIVCGWSGEWDHALRKAFLRAPTRRYPVFWATRGNPGTGAQDLIQQRRARIIPINDADSFFSTLRWRIETLEQSHRQNPLGIELQISSTKRFLSKTEFRIQLDELLTQEAERVLSLLDNAEFSPNLPWDPVVFRSRVQRYESLTETLAGMAGVLGRWGDDSELKLVLDIVQGLYAQANKIEGGVLNYLNLRSYATVLILSAYGIGLTRAERWKTLHDLFKAPLINNRQGSKRVVETLFHNAWKGEEKNVWNLIEGLEKRETPLSDHLLALLQEWSKRFVGLTSDFEQLFHRYELLGALAYFERNSADSIQKELQGGGHAWLPLGRIGWRYTDFDIEVEVKAPIAKSTLLAAGFALNDPDFIDLFANNFGRAANRLNW